MARDTWAVIRNKDSDPRQAQTVKTHSTGAKASAERLRQHKGRELGSSDSFTVKQLKGKK